MQKNINYIKGVGIDIYNQNLGYDDVNLPHGHQI